MSYNYYSQTNTTPTVAATGSVSLPGFYFGVDTSTGLYRIGSNNIGVSVSGAKVLDISSTGLGVTGTLSATGAITGNVGAIFNGNVSTTDTAAVALKIGNMGNTAPANQINAYIGAGVAGVLGAQNGDLIYIPRTTSAGNFGHRFFSESAGVATQRALIDNAGLAVTGTLSATGAITAIGNASAPGSLLTGGIYVSGANSTNAGIQIDTFGPGFGSIIVFRQTEGTAAAPTASVLNSPLGILQYRGYGTAYSAARATITAYANEAWSGTAQGTRFDISCTANTTTTQAVVASFSGTGLAVTGTLTTTAPASDGTIFQLSRNSRTLLGYSDTNGVSIGSSTAHNFVLLCNSAGIAIISSTGLAVTGTVSATDIISTTGVGSTQMLRIGGATTAAITGKFTNTGGDAQFGMENSAGSNQIVGSTGYDTIVRGPSGIAFSANAGVGMQMRLSAAGLAVTGTLSATQSVTVNSSGTNAIGLTVRGDNTSFNPRIVFLTGTGSSAGKLDWLDSASALQARFTYNDSIGSAFQWKPNGGTTDAMSLSSTGLAVTGTLTSTGQMTEGSATFKKSSTTLTNGAAAQTGTLTNAPLAGNPTKWVPIDDNGTTRYIPCW